MACGFGWLLGYRGVARSTGPVVLGLAVIVALDGWVSHSRYAGYLVPIAGLLGATGIIFGLVQYRWRALSRSGELLAALVTYAVFAAPAVVNGAPSWVGWLKLDDGSAWLVVADTITATGWGWTQPVVATPAC